MQNRLTEFSFTEGSPDKQSLQLFQGFLMGQNLPEKPILMKTLPTCHFRRPRSTASSISSATCRAAAGIDGKNSTAGHSASKARASVVPTSMGLNCSSMV